MKINVYLNEQFYKSYNLGDQEVYNPKTISDVILADKEAGKISSAFKINEGIAIRIEKVE
jgi:hypothetical protein